MGGFIAPFKPYILKKEKIPLASFRGAAVQPIPASWGTSTRLQENFHQNIAFLKLLY